MKLTNKMIVSLSFSASIVVSALIAVIMSCSNQTKTDNTSGGSEIAISPDPAVRNARTHARLLEPGLYKSYSWKIRDNGGDISGCASEAAELRCLLTTTASEVEYVFEGVRGDDNQRVRLSRRSEVVTSSWMNQAPIIMGDILKDGNNIATISNFPQNNRGSTEVTEGKSFTIDLSHSFDPEGDAISFFFDQGLGSGFSRVEARFNIMYPRPGIFQATLRAVDFRGATEQATFLVMVKCDPDIRQPVTITNVSVTPATPVGYFTYLVNAQGGVGPLVANWNFDGDVTLTDNEGPLPVNIPTTAYTIFAGLRNVRVQVTDSVCGAKWSETATLPYDFSIPVTPSTRDFLFVAGDVDGLNGYDSKSMGRAVVTDDGSTAPSKVRMNYNASQGKLSVTALYSRPGRSATTSMGYSFDITGIVDDLTNPMDTSNATMQNFRYYTDGQGDSINPMRFVQDQPCTLAVTGVRQNGCVPCDPEVPTGPQKCTHTYEFPLTFYCPLLTEDGVTLLPNLIEVRDGLAYVTFATQQRCAGGGGGGGGGVHPPAN